MRWEDFGLVDAANRVLNLVPRTSRGRRLEATPRSVNAKLPAARRNPGGGRVKVLHPVIALWERAARP